MARARAARKPQLGEMVATSRIRFTRVPPRKARIVADLIRGLTVSEATARLGLIHRPSAAPMVGKVLKSAVSNAEQVEDLEGNPQDLVVGEIFVDSGPMLKRWRARAMGRGVQIRKRMSHLTIKLYTQA